MTPIPINIRSFFLPDAVVFWSLPRSPRVLHSLTIFSGFNLFRDFFFLIVLVDCFLETVLSYILPIGFLIHMNLVYFYCHKIICILSVVYTVFVSKFWRTNCYISKIKFSVECRKMLSWRLWNREIYEPNLFSYGFIYVS